MVSSFHVRIIFGNDEKSTSIQLYIYIFENYEYVWIDFIVFFSGISIVQAASLWDDSGQIYLAWVRVFFLRKCKEHTIMVKLSNEIILRRWFDAWEGIYSALYCINSASTYYPIMTFCSAVLFVLEGSWHTVATSKLLRARTQDVMLPDVSSSLHTESAFCLEGILTTM